MARVRSRLPFHIAAPMLGTLAAVLTGCQIGPGTLPVSSARRSRVVSFAFLNT